MKPTEAQRTSGIFERRPSANRIPIGNAPVSPTSATTNVTRKPPQNSVLTTGKSTRPLVPMTKRTRSGMAASSASTPINDAVAET